MCWSLLLRLQHWYFPMKFAKFWTTPILKNICEQLLLIFKLYISCISKLYTSLDICWSLLSGKSRFSTWPFVEGVDNVKFETWLENSSRYSPMNLNFLLKYLQPEDTVMTAWHKFILLTNRRVFTFL